MRQSSKRKRDELQSTSPAKRRADPVHLKANPDAARDLDKGVEIDSLEDTRRILLKIFSAIETTLLSSRSMSTLHSIQQPVESTSGCNFEVDHLAQILGTWPNAYEVETVMALVNGIRIPSLSIARPHETSTAASSERRAIFATKLNSWTGRRANLPALERHTLLPLNTAKITSIRKQVTVSPIHKASSTTLPSAKDRQTALLDRIRTKALSKASDPTPESLKSATISAVIPAAVTSIKILLASRRTRAIGMSELCDNLGTSLSNRLGIADLQQLIVQVSRHPQYEKWCKIGEIGDVRVVRFIGPVPSVQTT